MIVIDSGYCKLKVRGDTGTGALGLHAGSPSLGGGKAGPGSSDLEQWLLVEVEVNKLTAIILCFIKFQFSSVQSLSRVRLFANP